MTGNNKMRRLLTMGLFLTVALIISAKKKGSFVVFDDKMTSVEVDAADWGGLKPSYLGPVVK